MLADDFEFEYEPLEGSTAYPTFLRELAGAMELGMVAPNTPHDKQHHVLYAVDKSTGKVAGALVHRVYKDTSKCWMTFSFVLEAYKGTGLFHELFARLETKMVANGIESLNGHIHVDNIASIKGCAKNGLVAEYIRVVKRL